MVLMVIEITIKSMVKSNRVFTYPENSPELIIIIKKLSIENNFPEKMINEIYKNRMHKLNSTSYRSGQK